MPGNYYILNNTHYITSGYPDPSLVQNTILFDDVTKISTTILKSDVEAIYEVLWNGSMHDVKLIIP